MASATPRRARPRSTCATRRRPSSRRCSRRRARPRAPACSVRWTTPWPTSDAWRRELDRVSEAWASERRDLEARCASLAERAEELEARRHPRATTPRPRLPARWPRRSRARRAPNSKSEDDVTRDATRCAPARGGGRAASSTQAHGARRTRLARASARANTAGFVEATQLTPDDATTRRRPSRDPPPTTARATATDTSPEEHERSPLAPSPAPGPALAPVATAAAKKRIRPPHPAAGVENLASGARMDEPMRPGPAKGPFPSSKWRRTGGVGALGDEPSLRANGVGLDVAHLWGDGSPRVGAARGGGGGFAPRRAGDAFAEEDREIFKIAPRDRDAAGSDGGGEVHPARNGDERGATSGVWRVPWARGARRNTWR